jgi:effector-binding domain-containing protein
MSINKALTAAREIDTLPARGASPLPRSDMNLTEVPQPITWPETHYVFVEKIGPFPTNAPQAWQSLHQFIPATAEHNQITGYLSLYKVGPQIYRAGVSLAGPPVKLPPDLTYLKFAGGKYSRFILTGPYTNLGPASGRVMELIAQSKLPVRDDFFIENYVNDPRTTPEDQLITEILVPTS